MTASKKKGLKRIDVESGELILDRCPNGGWIVSQHHGGEFKSSKLGAFSNAKDMLEALDAVLGEMDE